MSRINESVADFEKTIAEAIANYNKFRSPEAKASLVKVEDARFTVEFSGSFCYGCGVDAYFEDFIYELKRVDSRISVEIAQFRQTSPESYEVQYKVLNSKELTNLRYSGG